MNATQGGANCAHEHGLRFLLNILAACSFDKIVFRKSHKSFYSDWPY